MYMPKKVEWDETFATGDAQIDFQHKYLLATFNRLGEIIIEGAKQDSVSFILGKLRFYADWHFSKEEECMRIHECPAGEANKQAHAFFLRMLDGYLKDIENKDRLHELAVIVHSDMLDWLTTHILKVDIRLRECVSRPEE